MAVPSEYGRCVGVDMDNVTVHGTDMAADNRHLQGMLELQRLAGLMLNKEKCVCRTRAAISGPHRGSFSSSCIRTIGSQ